MVHTDWIWILTIVILAASTPLLIWIALFAFGYVKSRRGGYTMGVNVLAILGAFLAFVSFLTGWGVTESGNDWGTFGGGAFFLLFTYPLAVITPLAGFGQAGVLLWALSYAGERNGHIEPYYGYIFAWISVALMVASIAWPMGLSRTRAGPDIYDRLLTLTIRRTSRPWMSTAHAAAFSFTAAFLVVGTVILVFRRGDSALALAIMGILFVWFMLLKRPQAETRANGPQTESDDNAMICPRCGAHNPPFVTRCAGCGWALVKASPKASPFDKAFGTRPGHIAWIVFVVASYLAVIIALSIVTGGSRAGMWNLLDGAITLAIVVPLALIARRRAVAPQLPTRVKMASVTLFALFMLIACLMSAAIIRTQFSVGGFWIGGFSVGEYLIFAGIGLVGPAIYHLGARTRDERSRTRSSGSQ